MHQEVESVVREQKHQFKVPEVSRGHLLLGIMFIVMVAAIMLAIASRFHATSPSKPMAPPAKPISLDDAEREMLHQLVNENFEKQVIEAKYNNDLEFGLEKLERHYKVTIDTGSPRQSATSGGSQYHLRPDATGIDPGPLPSSPPPPQRPQVPAK